MNNKYTIIVPAHNESYHLTHLLSNLKSLDINPKDILVVDNGSTDKTAITAKTFGVNVVSKSQNSTPAKARNLGAESSESEFLVFLDADILVTSSWKSKLDEIVNSNERSVFGETYHLSIEPSWLENIWNAELQKRSKRYINSGNLIIQRKLFEELEGFSEQLETGEDVDFCERAKKNNITIIFEPGLIVHHEGNPRTIKQFIRRERWHGKGDLVSLRYFLASRVAITAALFLIMHIALIAFLPTNASLSFALAVSIVLLCLSISIYKFGFQINRTLQLSLICYFYLIGRSLSFLDKISAYFRR